MTGQSQRRLAIAGALALVAVFLGANAHLIAVAVSSQPPCGEISAVRIPAKHSC